MRSPEDTSEIVEWWLSHQSHRLCQLRRYQLITRSGISDTMTEYSSPENQSIVSPCRLHTTRLMGASGPLLRKITHRLGPGSALESLALLSSGVYFNLDDVGESARHQLLQKTEFSTHNKSFFLSMDCCGGEGLGMYPFPPRIFTVKGQFYLVSTGCVSNISNEF